MKPRLLKLDRRTWERETTRFLDHNYRQTWAYGVSAAERVGAVVEHIAWMADGEALALADVRVRVLPMVGGGIAYINGAPLVRAAGAPDDGERLGGMLGALRDEYVARRGMVLRVAPVLGDAALDARREEEFGGAGFTRATMGARYRTIALDINRPLDALRAGLSQKWRNCLNSGERQGVQIAVSADTAGLRRFADLYRAFAERKGLHVNHDAEFFFGVQEGLSGDDRLVVQLAERDGEVIAGHVSSMNGDTCVYLLGATTPAGLALRGAYLLQWNTVRLAHERGLRWYDLGGIDPEGNPGVYHFKKGLGGDDWVAPGPFECRPRGLRGRVVLSSERLYRHLRRVRGGDAHPSAHEAQVRTESAG